MGDEWRGWRSHPDLWGPLFPFALLTRRNEFVWWV